MLRINKLELLILLTVPAVVTSIAHAAELATVMDSNSGDYYVAQTIEADDTIMLEEGEVIVILTDENQELRVEGPVETTLATVVGQAGSDSEVEPEPVSALDVLARIAGAPRTETDQLAALRGSGADQDIVDSRPSAWLAHSEITGDQCVIRGANPNLWRESAGSAASVEIESVGSGRTVRASWPNAGQSATWPAQLPVEDGGIYLIREPGAFRSTAIRLHVLNPAIAEETRGSIIWMATKGCMAQARLLLADL